MVNLVNNMPKIKPLVTLLASSTTFLFCSLASATPDLDWSGSLDSPSVREYSFSKDTPLFFESPAQTPDYTTLPKKITGLGESAFIFSPKLQRWAAYDQYGYKVAGGVGNGGSDFCPELNEPCNTPMGEFRVIRKKGAECESSQFPIGEGGAAMPYCVFFKGGYAIHGSPYISTQNSSHGCVRVLTGAAEWLNKYFLMKGTKVIILPY